MRDQHIISLLANTPFASLSANDLIAIRAHAEKCSPCLEAFQAAQVSQRLLKERAAVARASEFRPSPFFHTRVSAALRERQAANDSWAFPRLWRAAGALASSMAAAVALLAVLTFVLPDTQVAAGSQVSSLRNGYSAEEVLLDQTSQTEELSDGQMLTTIYSEDEEASK